MGSNPKLTAEQHNLFNYILSANLVGLLLATMIFINQYSMVTNGVSCLSAITNAYGTSNGFYSVATGLLIHSKPGASPFRKPSLSCED